MDVLKNSNNERLIEHVGTNRMRLWKKAVIFTKEKPLFGYGINNLQKFDNDTHYLSTELQSGYTKYNFLAWSTRETSTKG